jgi:hypothetical protein
LPLYPDPHENDVFWKLIFKYGLISFAITSAVMLGTWPVVPSIYGRISLETFCLNLIMVLLLGLFGLPCCLLTLVVSALFLGNSPFGILEKGVFSLTKLVVEGWFAVLQNLYRWGDWASFPHTLDWGPPQFILFYAIIFGFGKLLTNRFREIS